MADVTQTSTNESATTTTAATMSSSTRANKSTLTPSDKTSTMTADTMDVTVNTDPSTSAATSSSNLTDPSPADVGTGTNVAHLTTQSNSSQQDQSSSLPSSVDTDESKDRSEPEMLCNICNVDDCDEHNALVLCDKCDVCVHSECYGYPLSKSRHHNIIRHLVLSSSLPCLSAPPARHALASPFAPGSCYLSHSLPFIPVDLSLYIYRSRYQDP